MTKKLTRSQHRQTLRATKIGRRPTRRQIRKAYKTYKAM